MTVCRQQCLPAHPWRHMNLHQAKGLEAPYVFLADPTGGSDGEISRTLRGPQRRPSSRFLADLHHRWRVQPAGLGIPGRLGPAHAQEKLYQDAEPSRLLYVAATRAGSRLMVTQRANANKRDPWSPLEEYLADCADLKLPEAVEHPQPPQRVLPADASTAAAAEQSQRWSGVCRPGYALAAAKAISVAGSRLSPAAGKHGTEWGSVIHLLLETAMRNRRRTCIPWPPPASPIKGWILLRRRCRRHGPSRDALRHMGTSEEQHSSTRRSPVPDAHAPRPEYGRCGSRDSSRCHRPGVSRSNRLGRGGLQNRCAYGRRAATTVAHYRGQVAAYADFWQASVGEPIAETGLYFTHLQRYAKL